MRRFHPHPRSRQIGTAQIAQNGIDKDNLEMDPGAHGSFQALRQQGIPVEIIAKRLAGFLGMSKRMLTPFLIKPAKSPKNGLLLSPCLTYKSLISAVPSQTERRACATKFKTIS